MTDAIIRQCQAIPHITYRNVAAAVVLNPAGEMLLAEQRNGTWSLPKGKIEEGEERSEAALREVWQETGIKDVTYVETLGSYTRYAMTDAGTEDRMHLKRITVMLFTTTETAVHPSDPRIVQVVWIQPKDAVSRLSSPKDKEFLTSVLPRL